MNENFKILIIDSDVGQAQYYQALLYNFDKNRFQVEFSHNLSEAHAFLCSNSVDLISWGFIPRSLLRKMER